MPENERKTRSLASTARSEDGGLALKPSQLQAIALLVHGRTIKDTAAEVGVHPGTVSTWLRENDQFGAEYERQRKEAYMRNIQLAHATLAEVMENSRETGLTRAKAAQAALLYDGQRLRARAGVDTASTLLDKLQAMFASGSEADADAIDAEYRAQALDSEDAQSALPADSK